MYSENELDITNFSIAVPIWSMTCYTSNNGAALDISARAAKQSCLWTCYTGIGLRL